MAREQDDRERSRGRGADGDPGRGLRIPLKPNTCSGGNRTPGPRESEQEFPLMTNTHSC